MIAAQPSRTALRVALRRAAHQLVDQPPRVLTDPFAVPLIGDELRDELRRTPSASRKPFSAALRAWVVARARFAEDVLAESASRSPSLQYLVLGAGLDTFALRNPYPHVRVFEVDHPATQAWKRERLRRAAFAVAGKATLVPVDFETQTLLSQLLAAGLDPELPTVSAWLGVVPYLSAEAFAATCAALASLKASSELIFDYSQPRHVLPPNEQLMHDSLAARVAQAGEPFRLFFTPSALVAQLRSTGLTVVEDLGSQEINQRYFAERIDGLAVRGTAGRLCHARSI